MSATTAAANANLEPHDPQRPGQRGRDAAGRRVGRAADGSASLQVGDTGRGGGGLKTSPSFSPAYLLAALDWAEDSENRNLDIDVPGPALQQHKHKPRAKVGIDKHPHPPPPTQRLAHKTAPNGRPRRRHDVNRAGRCRPPGPPPAPRIDFIAEKLVFPSRKTPPSFLPAPSSLSPNTPNTAAHPAFSSSPISPRFSPRSPLRPREQHHQYRHQHQHQHPHQQRPRTSNEGGSGRRRQYGYHHQDAAFSVDEVAQKEGETDRIPLAAEIGGQIRTDRDQATMYQSMQPPGAPQPSTRSPSPPRQTQGSVREAFAFLSRGRKKSATSESPRSTLSKRSRTLPTSSTSTSTGTDASDFPQSPATKSVSEMPAITEARNPTAKVVTVRCKGTTVTAEITKETSAADLLVECSQSLADLGQAINPDTCVVIEPCLRPGLERRLRQYERVWDVVSAWDHDSSNTLSILRDSSSPDRELSLSGVPKTLDEPEGFALRLYLLQRPGKWSQRFITLKENGQIFASKKENWKPSDKDVARLCHLTDFDLYTPTETAMRKQLRPPKRYCYAVRSQEKASLFVDSKNYVQYFCTDDPNAARQFRSSVQGWRSWYLVNKKLRLHEEQDPLSPVSNHSKAGSYRGRASVDQGSWGRPTLDRRPSTRSRPQSSREGTPPDVPGGASIPPVPALPAALRETSAAVFATGGLLGNGYDERKHQVLQDVTTRQRAGTVTSTSDDGPFVNGPNLLNSLAATGLTADGRPRTSGSDGSRRTTSRPTSPVQSSWFPSATQHTAEQRTTHPAVPLSRRPSTASHAPSRARSIRHHPALPPLHDQPPLPQQQQQQQPLANRNGPAQPLIDLTPTFIEPPQWSREGKGRGVRAPQGKPLVDLATGYALPPSTAARFRDAAAPPRNLVRRPDALLPPAGGGGGATGGAGTLMEQYELQKTEQLQQQRGRGNTLGSSAAAEGGGGGLLGGMGLVRRGTVKSVAGGGGHGGRPGTAAGHTLVSSSAAEGAGGGLLGGMGLVRRGTVKSVTGGGGGNSSRPGTAGRDVPPMPVPGSAAAVYMQSRGRMMGVGEEERERVKGRLRSVDGRGQGQGRGLMGEAGLSVRGKR